MKLQVLTIHNIASIEDAVINFEEQPLAESEVFLITGKTGAGKSTILDAICLALYADTPRLKNTKMQGKMLDAQREVGVDDPRQLMRRHTGEAFVSLTFVGTDGVHYQATWAVARARKNETGALQNKTWTLENLDAHVTLTRKNEIEEAIRSQAIGLDFSQFCRTTLLAQGDFTRFLNSEDKEKAAILEKITGVDIYSKIGKKVYDVTAEKERVLAEAKQRVEGTPILSDDEVKARQEQLAALNGQFEQVKAANDLDAKKRDWLLKEQELTAGKKQAAVALHEAQEVVEGPNFKQKEKTVKDWYVSADARHWLSEMGREDDVVTAQKQSLEALSAQFARLLADRDGARLELQRLRDEVQQVEAFVAAEAGKAGVYNEAQTLSGWLLTVHEGRRAVAKNRADIANEQQRLSESLSPALKQAQQTAHEALSALEKQRTALAADQEAIALLNLPGLRSKRDAARELLTKVALAKERLEALEAAKKDHELMLKGLAERKVALEARVAKKAALEEPLREAKIRMEVCKKQLEKQRDTVDKFASALRAKLQVGDVCPVCGQTIGQALPLEEELKQLVDNLQADFDKAEQEYKQQESALQQLEAECRTEQQAYERDAKACEQNDAVARATEKALLACQACGLTQLEDSTPSVLADLEASTKRDCQGYEKSIGEAEDREKETRQRSQKLQAQQKEVDKLNLQAQMAEKQVSECNARITTAEALVQSKQNEMDRAERNVSERLTGNWETDWHAAPKAFAESLLEAAKVYNDKVQRKRLLATQMESAQGNLERVQQVLDAILEAMPAWAEIRPSEGAAAGGGSSAVMKTDALLTEANRLNTSVTTALGMLKTAEENRLQLRSKLSAFWQEHAELDQDRLRALQALAYANIVSEEGWLNQARNKVVEKKTLFDNLGSQLADHLTLKPAFEEGDSLEVLNERLEGVAKQLDEIHGKQAAIGLELKQDAANRKRLELLIGDVEAKRADFVRWDRLKQLIGDATGNKFRTIAQSYVLSSLIRSANVYMRSLTNRYVLKVEPGTFVISLEDAYQGFVARAASTISGGESFLVSLSLALALSDIGSQLAVDTLFIDEGFGTLSGEPLQHAVDTLRSLHSTSGRHVGIISHVEELQNQIPVQIQVLQEGLNSSSKVNVVEV